MIELTVKTLDSQNHAFTVDDNLTVAQFKEKISEAVNIPADTQRIIYCGRLLQDESKLNEHDLDGKVVHLVQRPPPSATDRTNQRSESPPPQAHTHRRIRGLEYLGSMRFPASAFEQNIMPPLPTHSLAASRLNVARRMLRRAEGVLNALENPTARTADQPAQEEPQEEVTPVFEARVIVPSTALNEPNDEAAVLSSVQNSLLNVAGSVPINVALPASTSSEEAVPVDSGDSEALHFSLENPHSISSTPEVISPLATSSENLTTAGEEPAANGAAPEEDEGTNGATAAPNNASGTGATENISRTSEFADLLDALNRVQTRLAPFLEQYNNFMRQDPTITPENARATQAMINRVSEILHFLGHAYHSLSDMIVRVRTPAPRPLLCRPILIQHSAIVQAGIPIQVEAQINFSSDRNSNGNATTQPSSTATTNQTTTTTASNNAGPGISGHMQPTMVGFPLMPGTSVRVETFHLPQSATVNLDRSNLNRNNNNNRDGPFMSIRSTADILAQAAAAATVAAATGTGGIPIPVNLPNPENQNQMDPNSIANAIASSVVEGLASANAAAAASNPPSATTTNTNNGNSQTNNPNVEFFMEVTPESITIDSLETAFVGGGNQANDLLQATLNPPPPELIHSIMQMAGQLINRGAAQGVPAEPTQQRPSSAPGTMEPSSSDSQTTSSNAGAARTTPFQNSQARGNTQTQPTTATHTRSTARPHVHLAQHAMQGFDPFLPCNSHHVTPRRRFPQQANNAQQPNSNQANPATPTNATPQTPGEPRGMDPSNPFYNIMRNIINTVRTSYGLQAGPPGGAPAAATAPSASATTSTSNNPNGAATTNPAPSGSGWMSLQNMNLSDSSFQRAPTIAQLLQQLPDDSYVEGESIFTDLIMLLSRNLTIGDVMHLNGGRLEPLMRIRSQLRNFFLYRILDGSQSPASIDRGVDRLLTEMQPFLDHLALLNTRDDIDIVKSIKTLLKARLPNIIALVASRSPNSLKMVMDQVRTTAKHLCALALRASRNGRQGVEDVFDVIVSRYMQGIPRDLQQWTLITSRAQFSAFISNLDVPESILQPYIVREIDAVTSNVVEEPRSSSVTNSSLEPEPMQVEEEDVLIRAGGSMAREIPGPQINLAEDPEPLPNVVLGSEPWHSQVPADWVPIITRDSQRQRRQNSQPPFSDTYLSGMPSKRRKIVTNSKPQGSLPQVITESVRRAVTATGLSGTTPIDTVAQAAGADINIQSAYRDLLRSSVQSGLRDNADFTPERFPNASNYFNYHPQ